MSNYRIVEAQQAFQKAIQDIHTQYGVHITMQMGTYRYVPEVNRIEIEGPQIGFALDDSWVEPNEPA